MNKKSYEAPIVRKVNLEIKNALLSVCHSSMIHDNEEHPLGCRTAACAQVTP